MSINPLPPFLLVLLLAITLFANTTTCEPDKPRNHNHRKNAFDFVRNLKGCHKGQKNTSGLHHLKQYLEKFGYLNDDAHKNDNDDFDDALESAVKSYQQNYGLEVTGSLDDATVEQMAKPRCGFPDKTTNHNSNHRHHNRKLIRAVSHYSFFDGAPRWPASKSKLTWSFRTPAVAGAREACTRAFRRWEAVSRFTFQEVAAGSVSDIVIGFHRGEHGDRAPFDGFGGTLAHAFAPTVGMFHYDADESWSVSPGPSQADLESVAVHEIGHLLGLGHEPRIREAIMYPQIGYGEIKRDLHADDIRGTRALYG